MKTTLSILALFGSFSLRAATPSYSNFDTNQFLITGTKIGVRTNAYTWAGVTGPTGPQGIQGVAGTNGTNGLDGVNGTNGLNGVDGTNGVTGPQGIQGIPGTNGLNGLNGTNGSSGINGTNGVNGTNGAIGPQGIQGVDGTNAAVGLVTNDFTITPGLSTNNFLTPTNLLNGTNVAGVLTNSTTGNASTATTTTNLTGGATNQVYTQTGWSGNPTVSNLFAGTNFSVSNTYQATASVKISAGSSNTMVVVSGRVGIGGVTSPSAALEIRDGGLTVDGATPGFQINKTAGTGTVALGSTDTSGGSFEFQENSGNSIGDFTMSRYGSYIDYAQNLFFRAGGGAGVTTMTMLSTGNVGIGTTTPAQQLTVIGSVTVSNTITATNGFASYAVTTITTTATGCTNTSAVNQIVYVTAATGASLTDNAGTTEFSGVTVANFTPIRIQPGGKFVGTAITYAAGTPSHAW